MASNNNNGTILLFFLLLLLAAAAATYSRPQHVRNRRFEIADDMFWKDGEPFRIIGGDLHYFRVHPQYWEDRLLRAKALGLNAIQTYVPWNLHEPRQGQLLFDGIADILSFLELCQRLDLLVLLRAGPYICAEWDFGGFPAWLLAIEPAVRLRSSDPAFLNLVRRWWGILLPRVAPFLYVNGGPIIMVQVENEFGSYGDDKAYLRYLVKLAREHLGDNVILYTTDGGSRETLEKGTLRGDAVFSAVDFSTGDEPWPVFKLQKEYNAPGKSPPLSAEFYTGWLTHWGEDNAETGADFTASALDKILSRNASAVLYMAHGGTNFGFYNGANAAKDSEYKPDLTSYDYDAPISESGDVDSAKFKALRDIIGKYFPAPLPSVPLNNEKMSYGHIHLTKARSLFDLFHNKELARIFKSKNPISMEAAGQMFGFLLYVSDFIYKGNGSMLMSIPKVHDRAQVFVTCSFEDDGERPVLVGMVERWSNRPVSLPNIKCASKTRLLILVENMGRVNYGPYMFDKKGILSPVYLNGKPLHNWKMLAVPFCNLHEVCKFNPLFQDGYTSFIRISSRNVMSINKDVHSIEPSLYVGHFSVDKVKDTFLSFNGWGKGVAFVNDFNIGRFWPSFGPQCNLYVPAPILKHGENVVVVLALESPSPDLIVNSVNRPDFTCGSRSPRLHQL